MMLRFRQRQLLLVFIGAFLITLAILLRTFYKENTVLVPSTGGTYIEGSVGNMQPLLPWFAVQNDVNLDVISLVSAGLLRYDPNTKNITDDLATLLVSNEGKIYTVTLKKGLTWHDHTE